MRRNVTVALGLACASCLSAQGTQDPPTPSGCADLSGYYAFSPETSCQPWEGHPFDGLPLAGPGGYEVAVTPQVIRIEQRDCSELTFHARVRFYRGTERTVALTLPISAEQAIELQWTSEGLRYEYRPRKTGGPRFPGIGRRSALLEIRPTPKGIRYRYRSTERGAALLVFPFNNVHSSDCTLARVAGGGDP